MHRHIDLPNKRSNAPFSDAVLAGNTLYIAGRIGTIPGSSILPETPQDEAKFLMEDIKRILAEAGMTMDDLVMVQVCTPDVALFDIFNSVYEPYFTGKLPARAFLGSGPLLSGANFEMSGVAIKQQ
jgi:enamine deaminase RidA (YjgF/YER057c/UK114 family)